jgi:hypothetical protein
MQNRQVVRISSYGVSSRKQSLRVCVEIHPWLPSIIANLLMETLQDHVYLKDCISSINPFYQRKRVNRRDDGVNRRDDSKYVLTPE